MINASDLTRDEAIQWCIDNKVDFTKPKFPPPEGWMWFDTGVPAKGLTAIFTNSEDEDIESIDVLLAVAAKLQSTSEDEQSAKQALEDE